MVRENNRLEGNVPDLELRRSMSVVEELDLLARLSQRGTQRGPGMFAHAWRECVGRQGGSLQKQRWGKGGFGR